MADERGIEELTQAVEIEARGADNVPPESPLQRAARVETDLAMLKSVVAAMARTTIPPARPSLPVRAAKGSYRATQLGLAVLGALAAIAELLATHDGPFRAIFRALFERGP